MGKVFTFAEANGIQMVIRSIELIGTETVTFMKNGRKIVFDSWQVKNYPETVIGMMKRYFGIWTRTRRLKGAV